MTKPSGDNASLIERLRKVVEGDHKRGCPARYEPNCQCGYEEERETALNASMSALAKADERVRELETERDALEKQALSEIEGLRVAASYNREQAETAETRLDHIRAILASTDIVSLPNDYPTFQIAADRMERIKELTLEGLAIIARAEAAETKLELLRKDFSRVYCQLGAAERELASARNEASCCDDVPLGGTLTDFISALNDVRNSERLRAEAAEREREKAIRECIAVCEHHFEIGSHPRLTVNALRAALGQPRPEPSEREITDAMVIRYKTAYSEFAETALRDGTDFADFSFEATRAALRALIEERR